MTDRLVIMDLDTHAISVRAYNPPDSDLDLSHERWIGFCRNGEIDVSSWADQRGITEAHIALILAAEAA